MQVAILVTQTLGDYRRFIYRTLKMDKPWMVYIKLGHTWKDFLLAKCFVNVKDLPKGSHK